MSKAVLGWLQIALAAFATASASGLLPTLNPQITDIAIAVLGVLTGGHALTSASQEKS